MGVVVLVVLGVMVGGYTRHSPLIIKYPYLQYKQAELVAWI